MQAQTYTDQSLRVNGRAVFVFCIISLAIFLVGSLYFNFVSDLDAAPTGSLTLNIVVDLNANSKITAEEIADNPLPGVAVNLYDEDDLNNAPCAVGASNAAGQAIFTPADMQNCSGTNIRYEVITDDFPNQYVVGPVDMNDDDGNVNTSTFNDDPEDANPIVQIVDLSSDVTLNIAIITPRGYICSQDDAYAMTTCFINGDPLAPGSEAIGTDALVGFPYLAQGSAFPGTSMEYSPADHLATTEQVGSVWGLSYSRQTNAIFAGAFLKRHTGLGPLGLDGIYRVELDENGPILTNWLEIQDDLGVDIGQGLVPSNAGRGLAVTLDGPSRDPVVFPLVAKVGLGDVDLVSDEMLDPLGLSDNIWIDRPYLLAVDLFNKDVLVIDLDNRSLVLTYDIPAPTPVCNLGEHRPWAVDYADGKMFVGIVCDASQDLANMNSLLPNSNLEAIIYEYDLRADLAEDIIPAAPTVVPTEILRFGLDYEKGQLRNEQTCIDGKNWHPWSDDITPSANHYDICWPVPILSDIEFSASGNMIIGFTDRSSHQWGFFNYSPDPNDFQQFHTVSGGDVLMACPDAAGNYVLESNGSCGTQNSTLTAPNGEGPGGSEFFHLDVWNTHHETVNGGLAVLPGSTEVMVAGMDPVGNAYFSAGGINWFSTEDGSARDPGYMLYASANTNSPVVIGGSFGKSGGLGDVDLICPRIPLNIGDYIWFDGPVDTANGVQDPGEIPLEGVLVTLTLPEGNTITTTTNAKGHYDFTVGRDRSYTITIDVTTATNMTGTLLSPTIQNSQRSSDINDSDANEFGQIFVTTDRIGTSDHTLDAGFVIDVVVPPTAVELTSLTAVRQTDKSVAIAWENASEINNFGFKLYRAATPDFEQADQIALVPSKVINGVNTSYIYIDETLEDPNGEYWYWLVDVDTSSVETRHDPVYVEAITANKSRSPFQMFLSLIFGD